MDTDETPAAIRCLEEETGEEIPWVPEEPGSQPRHLSVRLPDELAAGIDLLAAERVSPRSSSRISCSRPGRVPGQRIAGPVELVERMTEDLAQIRRLAG